MGRGRVRCALLYSCIGPAHFLGMRRVGGAIDVVETGILNAKHGKISFQIRVMPPYARLCIHPTVGWGSGSPLAIIPSTSPPPSVSPRRVERS